MSFDQITHTLSAAVGAGASFTVAYPTGRTADDYLGSPGKSQIASHSIRTLFQASKDFSVAFGASLITFTILVNEAFSVGSILTIDLDRGENAAALANAAKMNLMTPVRAKLGVPITADADGAVASQSATLASGLATGINGALATGGVATFDVPRNVVAAWTNTAVLTVTGTDEYGVAMRESSASGTSMTGKKAFKTVTGVTVSADVTGLTVGSGTILGLPFFLADAADIFRESVDGAAPTVGTTVAGDQNTATATTGDVRGTYNPNAAPNGSRNYEVNALVRSTSYKGVAQFAG